MTDIYSIIDFAVQEGCELKPGEPLKNHTTMKLGGKAKLFIEVPDVKTLMDLMQLCQDADIKYSVLGNGSNLIASDAGFDGIIFSLRGTLQNVCVFPGNVMFCGAGVSLSTLCKIAYEHSMSGLEFAWGIPGSLGGAIKMNCGAFGGEMGQIVATVFHITGSVMSGLYTNVKGYSYKYRTSPYTYDDDFIITGALLKLNSGNKEEIKAKMDENLQRRRETQPIDMPSAGSIFLREGDLIPAKIIEECGLKGYRMGGAQVSEKHAGFIVNNGHATSNEVMDLIEHIKQVVYEKEHIMLHCEVKYLGDDAHKWNL